MHLPRSFVVTATGAVLALVGFLFPWISCDDQISTGLEVARQNYAPMVVPIASVACLVVVYAFTRRAIGERTGGGVLLALGGAAVLGLLAGWPSCQHQLFAWRFSLGLEDLFTGFWLSLVGCGLVVVGGRAASLGIRL